MTVNVSGGPETPQWWESILHIPEYSDKLLWLLAALLLAPLVLRHFRISISLVYHMKFRRDRSDFGWLRKSLYYVSIPFRILGAFFHTLRIAVANLSGFVLKKYSISDIVRIWIEHDIFDKEFRGPWAGAKEKGEGGQRDLLITVEHPGIVMDLVGQIDRYCRKVDELGAADRQDRPGFLCPIKIESGFIAAFHLLSGLQGQFGATWPPILRGFEAEAKLDDALQEYDVNPNFQQIQSYIYYCWLLWGPSIPVCSGNCARWEKDYLWLQYGFGDENNSIDIVGKRAFLRSEVEKFLPSALPKPDGLEKGVMAVPASVLGRLRYDHVRTFESGEIAPAARDRLQAKTAERRSLLFVDEIVSDAKPRDRSLYYSGYLWVMFVILGRQVTRTGKEVWLPLHPDRDPATGASYQMRSAMPWKDTIPFFEHGNFADPETCMFGKQQLVEKALNGLAALVRDNGEDAFPLRFAYACAIDDPNCNWDPRTPDAERVGERRGQLAFPELAGGRLIVDLLQERIAEEASNPESAIGKLAGGRPPLVNFEQYSPASGNHPHSACNLPEHIGRHFEALGKLTEKADRLAQ